MKGASAELSIAYYESKYVLRVGTCTLRLVSNSLHRIVAPPQLAEKRLPTPCMPSSGFGYGEELGMLETESPVYVIHVLSFASCHAHAHPCLPLHPTGTSPSCATCRYETSTRMLLSLYPSSHSVLPIPQLAASTLATTLEEGAGRRGGPTSAQLRQIMRHSVRLSAEGFAPRSHPVMDLPSTRLPLPSIPSLSSGVHV
jgi:hypothetical protein